jgi:hypothetical protein
MMLLHQQQHHCARDPFTTAAHESAFHTFQPLNIGPMFLLARQQQTAVQAGNIQPFAGESQYTFVTR